MSVIVANGGPGINIQRPTIWGNPFNIGRHGDRDAVVDKHRQWLWEVLFNPNCSVGQAFKELVDAHMRGEHVRLVCGCHPLRCHGHNIQDFIVWFAERGGYPLK